MRGDDLRLPLDIAGLSGHPDGEAFDRAASLGQVGEVFLRDADDAKALLGF